MQKLLSLFSLEGRVALVTGGTGGVGAMLARGLMIAGGRVLISGRNESSGAESVSALAEYGDCTFIRGDLSTTEGTEKFAGLVSEQAPGLNILVNNAGITSRDEFGKCQGRDFDQVLSVNVKAPFLLTQALYPLLKHNASASRPSHVINTGSLAGLVNQVTSFSYGPSKAALHHLTKVLARQLAPDHIRVNAIAPGLFESRMTSEIVNDEQKLKATASQTLVGRIGAPDDLAGLIIAIATNAYMTGNIIPIDGGLGL